MSGTIHLLNTYSKKKYTNTSFYHSPHLPKKHNHVEIRFNNLKLIYNDPRRFGYILFINSKTELLKKLKKFGPEPFSKNFNINYVKTYFKNKKKNIKNFLLDQNFVSGIGNIYASEILFECKINPLISAELLKEEQIDKIIKYSKKVLKKSIIKGGSSIRDFKNISGDKGSFQNEFKVYNRENLKCPRKTCRGKIFKIVITNRSSFFCNKCQK
jgi:Formamidopyrimidine-DNA glycosylase